MKRLLVSAKFWVFIIAQVVAALTLFGTSAFHLSPDLVKYLIGFIEGLGAVLIGSIAYEDGKAKAAGTFSED